jgi:hypothetical protein
MIPCTLPLNWAKQNGEERKSNAKPLRTVANVPFNMIVDLFKRTGLFDGSLFRRLEMSKAE